MKPGYVKSMVRHFAHRLVPSLRRTSIWFEGPLSDWSEAVSKSSGYEQAEHIARVFRSTKEVMDRGVGYERDGVFVEEWTPDTSVALGVLLAISDAKRPIRVLDVGGAMGGAFLRTAPLADHWLKSWDVLDLRPMAESAKTLGHDKRLHFFSSFDEVLRRQHDLVILGSVAQYVRDPNTLVLNVSNTGARTMVFSRTPLSDRTDPVITIEHVPEIFGKMNYPMWVLSMDQIRTALPKWRCLLNEESLGGRSITSNGVYFSWRNLVFNREPKPEDARAE